MKTAESVAIGHPDKICDQISDAILDACLEQDPNSRVAIEVLGGHGIITVCGELTTKAYVNIRAIALRVYSECGGYGDIGVQVNVVSQSPQIAAGVDNEGAGDQGIMTGYATAETPEMLPLEVVLSRKLTQAMGAIDGKSQVTVNKDKKVETVITSICTQSLEQEDEILTRLEEVVDSFEKAENFKWLQNPNGKWDIGGFTADTGLTGRKLAVDNYGPAVPLGGGCFSGKDATKVDRSAAYMARKIACDFVRQGYKEVFVELAYAIGVAEPVAATAWADGKEIKIEGYDLRPRAIIETLGLRRPIFRETAMYGHYGHGFNWD